MKRTVLLILTNVILLHSQSLDAEKLMCSRGQLLLKQAAMPHDVSAEQQKMDVTYYQCVFDFTPAERTFEASVLARIAVVDTPLSQIELDFNNHTIYPAPVESVTVNGDTSSYTHTGNIIAIPAPESSHIGDTLEVIIGYRLGPFPYSDNWPFNFDIHNGRNLIWTMSQPFDARFWWPCKDTPSDKADSMDIFLTVPDPLIAVSNGRLVSTLEEGEGRTTYHWHEGYPISTYLFSLAIYPYYVWGDEYVSPDNDTLPIAFYTFTPQTNPDPSYLVTNYMKTRNMLEVFTGIFGEYPFMDEKYGHAEWGASYGMEHQTITSMGNPTERRVAHELAHQWWGDMITCDSYHHMWLNEGFGTYAEALWVEAINGKSAYHSKMQDFAYYGSGTIFVENPQTDDVFDYYLNYRKGAWVLHMLRNVVGDSAFFRILRTYGDAPDLKYGTATTEQFRDICEEVSGLELDAFFQQWIHGSYYPAYSYSWSHTSDSLRVTIRQTQQTGTIFQMPIDLKVMCTDTSFTWVVHNTLAREEFRIPLSAAYTVINVLVDPENWILRNVNYLALEEETIIPRAFQLFAPYPNPFNAASTIPFYIPQHSAVQLKILDLQGCVVWEHADQFDPGTRQVIWGGISRFGNPVVSGTYLVRLTSDFGAQTKKLVLMK
jgi:aminopeptidase N